MRRSSGGRSGVRVRFSRTSTKRPNASAQSRAMRRRRSPQSPSASTIRLRTHRALAGQNGLGSIELDDGRQVDASNLHLVVAGEDIPQLRGVPRVIQLGRVEDDVRWALVRGALAMVSPSTSESLSLVVLEAWLAGRSVIVNEACDVTAGHVRRSGGGVAINFTEASAGARALVAAIADRSTRDDRARRGREYVRARYSWGPVVDAYETVADAIVAGGDVGAALRSWAGRHRSWVR